MMVLIMDSKTYCPYPWVSLMTHPGGAIGYCCVASSTLKHPDGSEQNIKNGDTLTAAWNSPHMQDIRNRMIRGDRVQGCEGCYRAEAQGFESYRQRYIRDWSHIDPTNRQVVNTMDNGTVDSLPIYLDFRLSTLCNLKCRMCTPQNSSQLFREFTRIDSNNSHDGEFLKRNYTWGNFGSGLDNWADSELFLSDVENLLPHVNKLYFTGGEPTLIERVYWILNRCVELGINDKIELQFNSNMTNAQSRFIELLEKFPRVLMCVSVDAVGELNEYIRGASHWSSADANIRKYAASNIEGELLFTPVIQSYNILNIVELLDYCETLEMISGRTINVNFLNCDFPPSLNYMLLPQAVRDLAASRIINWMERSTRLINRSHVMTNIRATVDLLQGPGIDDDKLWSDFVRYTRLLDRQRNESFSSSCSELYAMIKDRYEQN